MKSVDQTIMHDPDNDFKQGRSERPIDFACYGDV